MEEEELRKIRNDMRVARMALIVGELVMQNKLSKQQLEELINLDRAYLKQVREICSEVDDFTEDVEV